MFPRIEDGSFEESFMTTENPTYDGPWVWEEEGADDACWTWYGNGVLGVTAHGGSHFIAATFHAPAERPPTLTQVIGAIPAGHKGTVTFYARRSDDLAGTLTVAATTDSGTIGSLAVAFEDIPLDVWTRYAFDADGNGEAVTISLVAEETSFVETVCIFVDDISIHQCPFAAPLPETTDWSAV